MLTEIDDHIVILGHSDCDDCGQRIFGRNHHLSGEDRRARKRTIFKTYGRQCLYCGVKQNEPTIDHVVPISKGGTSALWNTVPCCNECNASKGSTDLYNWLHNERLEIVQKVLLTIYGDHQNDYLRRTN